MKILAAIFTLMLLSPVSVSANDAAQFLNDLTSKDYYCERKRKKGPVVTKVLFSTNEVIHGEDVYDINGIDCSLSDLSPAQCVVSANKYTEGDRSMDLVVLNFNEQFSLNFIAFSYLSIDEGFTGLSLSDTQKPLYGKSSYATQRFARKYIKAVDHHIFHNTDNKIQCLIIQPNPN